MEQETFDIEGTPRNRAWFFSLSDEDYDALVARMPYDLEGRLCDFLGEEGAEHTDSQMRSMTM